MRNTKKSNKHRLSKLYPFLKGIFPKVIFDVVLLIVISLYIFALKDDISVIPPAPATDVKPHIPDQAIPGVYLISYADGDKVFFQNQNTLAFSGINKGIDFIYNYNKFHLDPKFVKDHAAVFAQKKGAGLWLWKPWVISYTLEKIPENAVVFYADSGIVFHSPIHDFVKMIQDHDMILVGDDPKFTLGANTKREVFIKLECDNPEFRKLMVVGCSFIILRNTPSTRAFIKKWLEICSLSDDMMNDNPSSLPEHPEFKKHLPEQSILGILYHKDPAGKLIIKDEVALRYISWPHRHPGTYRKFHSIMTGPAYEKDSLLPYLQKNRYFFVLQDFLLNNRIISWIRNRF